VSHRGQSKWPLDPVGKICFLLIWRKWDTKMDYESTGIWEIKRAPFPANRTSQGLWQ
jgi:hypothetical protein